MTRGLESAALDAVQAEVVVRVVAVALDFPSGVVRYSGAPFDLTIGGETFFGLGELGQISTVEESAELRSYGLTVAVSGIPRDVVAAALTEAYQGRRGTVWEAQMDAAGLVVADPVVIFRGRMDQLDVLLGETATVTVRLENRLADWERPRIRRYTDEEQQAEYPGDRFFGFLSATVEKDLIWPASTFRG